MKIPGLKKGAQEKVNAALARARGAGAKFARGGQGTLLSAGTGAACFYAVDFVTGRGDDGKPRVEMLANNKYAAPALLAVVGHMVKRKQYDVGAAMIGVAGYEAAKAFASKKTKSSADTIADVLADANKGASGYGYGGAYGMHAGELVMPAGEVIVPQLPTVAGHMHPSYGMGAGEAGAIVEPASARSFLALSDV